MENDYFADPYVQTMIENMPEKTGKSWEEWQQLLTGESLSKHGAIMALLKGEHKLTHGYANTIALLFRQKLEGGPPSDSELIMAQYSKKQALKPWYQHLVGAARRFGPDVEVAPKKSYVSLRRATQFAIIQPSTKTRLDLGLKLKDQPASGQLMEGDKWNGMCTNRVEIHSQTDITPEVIDWLRKAYEEAG
jgi:predicted transport protein